MKLRMWSTNAQKEQELLLENIKQKLKSNNKNPLWISLTFKLRLSAALLEKETLDLHSIVEILGERPFPPKSNFKAYLEYKNKEEKFEKEMEEVRKEDEKSEEEQRAASA